MNYFILFLFCCHKVSPPISELCHETFPAEWANLCLKPCPNTPFFQKKKEKKNHEINLFHAKAREITVSALFQHRFYRFYLIVVPKP